MQYKGIHYVQEVRADVCSSAIVEGLLPKKLCAEKIRAIWQAWS